MKLNQSEHARINAREYPGTRQLCIECDEPTELCEGDDLWVELQQPHLGQLVSWWYGPLCPSCYDKLEADHE